MFNKELGEVVEEGSLYLFDCAPVLFTPPAVRALREEKQIEMNERKRLECETEPMPSGRKSNILT